MGQSQDQLVGQAGSAGGSKSGSAGVVRVGISLGGQSQDQLVGGKSDLSEPGWSEKTEKVRYKRQDCLKLKTGKARYKRQDCLKVKTGKARYKRQDFLKVKTGKARYKRQD